MLRDGVRSGQTQVIQGFLLLFDWKCRLLMVILTHMCVDLPIFELLRKTSSSWVQSSTTAYFSYLFLLDLCLRNWIRFILWQHIKSIQLRSLLNVLLLLLLILNIRMSFLCCWCWRLLSELLFFNFFLKRYSFLYFWQRILLWYYTFCSLDSIVCALRLCSWFFSWLLLLCFFKLSSAVCHLLVHCRWWFH